MASSDNGSSSDSTSRMAEWGSSSSSHGEWASDEEAEATVHIKPVVPASVGPRIVNDFQMHM